MTLSIRHGRFLRSDANRYFNAWGVNTPSVGAWMRLIFLTPGFQLSLSLRFQSWLGKVPVIGKALRRIVWYLTTMTFGCDIDPQSRFGEGLFLPHPLGIVIGGEVIIGRNVAILHGVTLGRRGGEPTDRLIIEDDVEIGAGAKVLGTFSVGQGARIGANAVVLKPVPAHHIAIGVPARIVRPRSDAQSQ